MDFEIVVVAQPPGRIDKAKLPNDDRIVILEEASGKGIGHYRQLGAERARGGIIAWIDDDERPMDSRWLAMLAGPIAQGNEKVVTAGNHIPLGQGYLADSISWLGLPGGGYPGFEAMWEVDAHGYTSHLCTGNFAICRQTLVAVGGFNELLKTGNEDTELADRLVAAGVSILYRPAATVIHEARRELGPFMRWHVRRGRAHRELIKVTRNSKGTRAKAKGRLVSTFTILRRTVMTRYFPGVLLALMLQYACQLAGYLGLVKPSCER